MTTRLYLDRRSAKNGLAPIKVAINAFGSSAYISTGISVSEDNWDSKTCKVVVHPLKARLNTKLAEKKLEIDNAIETLNSQGALKGLKLSRIRQMVLDYISPERTAQRRLFLPYFEKFASKKIKYGTKKTYDQTAKKIRAYSTDAERLSFSDINRDWLEGFDKFMAKTAPSRNARNIHLRNIRAVFNDARDAELITDYPFRKFKIRPEATKNRALTAGQLRAFFDYPCAEWQRQYVDIFRLTVMLCGINIADLVTLHKVTNGRIEYTRQKTGQRCSVRVEPEAMEIIERYRGEKFLLDIGDRYKNYRDYLHHFNDALQKVGLTYQSGRKPTGDPLFPTIGSYTARYSWASIAAELDIPKETISAALGHRTNDVTSIYIRVSMDSKVDAANRAVIDAIFK